LTIVASSRPCPAGSHGKGERHTLREIFGLLDAQDERWQMAIDHVCHNYGVGQLCIGLMAEICIELIKIPNTIIYTGEVDDCLVAAGLVFVGVGALLLVRHVLVMFFFLPRSVAVVH